MAEKCFSGKQPVYVVRRVPETFDHQFFYDKELVSVDGAYRKCKTAQLAFFSRPQELENASQWRIGTKNIVVHEPVTIPVKDRKETDAFPEIKAATAAGAKELVLVGYDDSPALTALLAADLGKVTVKQFMKE